MEQPKGPILLVIPGSLARANGPDRASFDLDTLKQVELTSLVAATARNEGACGFEGVVYTGGSVPPR